MRKLNKGFTLVELVVVITIIAILIALAIVAINTVRRQARNTQLRNDAQTIKIALESRFASEQDYPPFDTQTAYGMVDDDDTVVLEPWVDGRTLSKPSEDGDVCYNGIILDEAGEEVDGNSYELWVITEERAGGTDDVNCSDGVDDTPAGDNYSLN